MDPVNLRPRIFLALFSVRTLLLLPSSFGKSSALPTQPAVTTMMVARERKLRYDNLNIRGAFVCPNLTFIIPALRIVKMFMLF